MLREFMKSKFLLVHVLTILMIPNLAVANIAWLSVRGNNDVEDKELATVCLEALMNGNLLKISGDSWSDYNGNIEFVSFYDGAVFHYFGYSGHVVCNIENHGAGELLGKGLFDERFTLPKTDSLSEKLEETVNDMSEFLSEKMAE